MRSGENALDVIDRVKAKIREIEPGLPPGVKIVPIYDRSQLINRSISNVKVTILEVIATIVLIILIFLWHFPSAAIPIVTMPVAVLLSFIPFRLMGISTNIMSLTGVAIAFSELVDASIVVVEQTHKKLEQWERNGRVRNYRDVVLSAVKEVAGPTFFALLVIAVSFLPVLAYDGANMTQIDAGGILDIAMAGTSATLLARKWESALLVNVDNNTLKRLMDNKDAMDALLRIVYFFMQYPVAKFIYPMHLHRTVTDGTINSGL